MSIRWIRKPIQKLSRIIILDSSFNPPTLAHIHLLQSVSYLNLPYLLLYSTKNVDKEGKNLEIHYSNFLNLLVDHFSNDKTQQLCFAALIDNAPRFIDKYHLLKDVISEELYWIMGWDTITRFFDSKYYPQLNSTEIFHDFFSKSKILLAARGSCIDTQRVEDWNKEYHDSIQWISEWQDNPFSYISSTLVRESFAADDLDKANACVIPSVFDYIRDNKLYMK